MNETEYGMQPAYQAEPEKPQIDMLPCSISPKPWFYAVIVCFFVGSILTKILMHHLHYTDFNSFNEVDDWLSVTTLLSPLLAIPGIAFAILFANGCKKLIHNEYNYALIFVCLNIADVVISFIGGVTEVDPQIPFLFMALLGIPALVMIFLLTHSFVNNYTGELRYLGVCMRDVLMFIFIIIGVIIFGGILLLITESDGVAKILTVISACLGLYTLYLTYLALRQMCDILEEGHDAGLTDYDLECALNGCMPEEDNNGGMQQPAVSAGYFNRNQPKSGGRNGMGASFKVWVITGILIFVVLCGYAIVKISSEDRQLYGPQQIEDYGEYEGEEI